MKNLLLTILLLIPVLAFSQARVFNGHLDTDGELVDDYYSDLHNDFDWKIDEVTSRINCIVYTIDGEEVVDTLSWIILSSEDAKESERYLVTDGNELEFYIDFAKSDNKSVLIFNKETMQFSIMEGEGVQY